MNGIDISNYQNGISLATVRPGFVVAKISEGTSFRDKAFDVFFNDCKSLGIPIGAYVYSHSTSAERGRAEAEYALSILAGRMLDLPIYLDIEGDILGSGKQTLTSSAIAFADAVRAKGYRAGVYASLYSYQAYLDTDALRAHDISIWVAQWGVASPAIECDLWQKNVGHISGYGGEIDLDVMVNNILTVGMGDEKQYSGLVSDDDPPIVQKLYPADMSVLCRGFYGTQVELLQRILGITADGIFGADTDNAVKEYQKANGLVADGIVGNQTWAKLKQTL